MVELVVVTNCGNKIYKTNSFKDKHEFELAISDIQAGKEKVIFFVDRQGKYVSISPTNCVIECTDC